MLGGMERGMVVQRIRTLTPAQGLVIYRDPTFRELSPFKDRPDSLVEHVRGSRRELAERLPKLEEAGVELILVRREDGLLFFAFPRVSVDPSVGERKASPMETVDFLRSEVTQTRALHFRQVHGTDVIRGFIPLQRPSATMATRP